MRDRLRDSRIGFLFHKRIPEQLPHLGFIAINGSWETLLVGHPRHEDGGGSGRPPLDAIRQSDPASGGLALLRLFGFRTEETLALR